MSSAAAADVHASSLSPNHCDEEIGENAASVLPHEFGSLDGMGEPCRGTQALYPPFCDPLSHTPCFTPEDIGQGPDDFPPFSSLLLGLFPVGIRRWFDHLTDYPEALAPRTGDGALLDSEEYLAVLCTGCHPEMVDALSVELPNSHYCFCGVQKRCRRCDPHFRGVTVDLLDERKFFLPSEAVLTLNAMYCMKRGSEKKNMQVAWTAYCEKFQEQVDLRTEAMLNFIPAITRLQATPAHRTPRWFLHCPYSTHLTSLREFFGYRNNLYDDRAVYATPWRRGDDGGDPDTSETASSRSEELAEFIGEHGHVPARRDRISQDVADKVGITGSALPTRLPSDGPAAMTSDGRHEVTECDKAKQIAPTLGNAVFFDPNDPHNNVSVMVNRIGGRKAEKRTYRFKPTKAAVDEARRILSILQNRVFTRERVLQACMELGLLEQLFDPKLGPDRVRSLVETLLTGYGLKTTTALMVKSETTAKASKPPRGVMDAGLEAFVASAYVHKIIEHVLSHFDEPCNIKHRGKDEVMTGITTQCSRQHIRRTVGGLSEKEFPDESFRLVESDYSKFEYSQALEFDDTARPGQKCWSLPKDEYSMGVLAWERDLIRWVSSLLPDCLNECAKLMDERNLPAQAKTNFVAKLKDNKIAFDKPSWNLVVFLLCRKSGDAQTSYANRLNNMIAMAIATLERGRDLFHRLADIMEGKKDANRPDTWIFKSRTGDRLYWRPWLEGDDFMSQVAHRSLIALRPTEGLAHAPYFQEVLRTLNEFGLESSYELFYDGRVEFVGMHALIEQGFTRVGAFCPDVARGIITASVATSEALNPAYKTNYLQIALSFKARAAMFRGRVDPMYKMFDSYAEHYFSQAVGGADGLVRVGWKDSQLLNVEVGTPIPAGVLWKRYQGLEDGGLTGKEQHALASASVQGHITAAEWANWCSMSFEVDMRPTDVLAQLPRAVVALLDKSWK